MEIADLARAYFDAVVMELVAKEETRGLALIEADGDDRAAPSNDTDRLIQGACAARAFERDGDAVSAVLALEFPCNIFRGVERNEAERFRDGEALRYAIHGVHGRRARRSRDLREDQPDPSATAHDR